MHRARWRIQPHAIGQPPVLVGIIGQHQRDPARAFVRGAQLGPVLRQFRHEFHPVALCAIGGDRALRGLVEKRLALEAHRAAQNPPVDLGQGHVHGDVARRKTAQPGRPRLFARSRQHHLENRRAIGRLHGQRVVGAVIAIMGRSHRKGGAVQDHRGRRGIEQMFERRHRHRVLQRGHENRKRRHARAQQRFHQPVDRIEPRPLQKRAVKDQRHHRRALAPGRFRRRQVRDPRTGPIDPGAQQRAGGSGVFPALQHGARIGQEIRGVLRPPSTR